MFLIKLLALPLIIAVTLIQWVAIFLTSFSAILFDLLAGIIFMITLAGLMLVEIPPKVAVSSFMGYLKGKSSLMIYEQFPELKYKYRNREFWCRGYYVDTAGKNAKKIQEYIQQQYEKDKAGEQLTMPNF